MIPAEPEVQIATLRQAMTRVLHWMEGLDTLPAGTLDACRDRLRSALAATPPTLYTQGPERTDYPLHTYLMPQGLSDQDHSDQPTHTIAVLDEGALALRLVFGDTAQEDLPNIHIERQPCGWSLHVHPDSGDPVCELQITDPGDGTQGPPIVTVLDLTGLAPGKQVWRS